MNTELENKLMTSYKVEMVSFLKNHPEFFEEAMNLAVADKQPYSWRAAYLIWDCMEANDPRVRKHIKKIIDVLLSKNDGHQRELMKILMKLDLPKKYEGFLFDTCVNIWKEINKQPSVRHTAFRFLIQIVKKYPELVNEIDILLQNQYLTTLSPGVRKSIFKMVKKCSMFDGRKNVLLH